jgi:hypothetical protein
MFHLSIREEIAATMIAELVYQMAYTALRAPEIDKSNASYRPLIIEHSLTRTGREPDR